jgi:uncharacterized protein
VAGFVDELPALPQLNEFVADGVDPARLKAPMLQRTGVVSLNDSIVPPAHTRRLSALLDAKLITVPQAGHFLASEGFTELPAVCEELSRMLDEGCGRPECSEAVDGEAAPG